VRSAHKTEIGRTAGSWSPSIRDKTPGFNLNLKLRRAWFIWASPARNSPQDQRIIAPGTTRAFAAAFRFVQSCPRTDLAGCSRYKVEYHNNCSATALSEFSEWSKNEIHDNSQERSAITANRGVSFFLVPTRELVFAKQSFFSLFVWVSKDD